ncbi:SA1002 family membrane protein [Actinomyces sp.]
MLTAFYTVTTISLVIACGFAVYGRNRRGLVFARAVGYLALSALINMVLIAALLSIFVTGFVVVSRFAEGQPALSAAAEGTISTAGGKFRGGTFLLMTLTFILAAALIQSYIHRATIRRFPRLEVSEETFQVAEYVIQWMTLFLAIYQFFFNGLSDFIASESGNANASYMFTILLSPDNINLILQPVLFSTWVMVVIERLHFRHRRSRLAESPNAKPPLNRADQ